MKTVFSARVLRTVLPAKVQGEGSVSQFIRQSTSRRQFNWPQNEEEMFTGPELEKTITVHLARAQGGLFTWPEHEKIVHWARVQDKDS